MTNREIKGKNRKISSNFLILLQNKNKTMDRETIEKAALEHALNTTGLDYIGEVACENGFIAGADWRINSVWHSADEEPETGRMILVRKCIARNHVSYQLKVKEALPYWERGARFIGGWAYLSDLLPTENAENFQRNSADFPRKFRECRKTSSGGNEAEQ